MEDDIFIELSKSNCAIYLISWAFFKKMLLLELIYRDVKVNIYM